MGGDVSDEVAKAGKMPVEVGVGGKDGEVQGKSGEVKAERSTTDSKHRSLL